MKASTSGAENKAMPRLPRLGSGPRILYRKMRLQSVISASAFLSLCKIAESLIEVRLLTTIRLVFTNRKTGIQTDLLQIEPGLQPSGFLVLSTWGYDIPRRVRGEFGSGPVLVRLRRWLRGSG